MNTTGRRVVSAQRKRDGKESKLDRPKTTAGMEKKNTSRTGNKLKAKEDEYRKLNAELEAKTASLVKEAEEIMRGNHSFLNDNISDDEDSYNVLTTREEQTSTINEIELLKKSTEESETQNDTLNGDMLIKIPSGKPRQKRNQTTSGNQENISVDIERTVRQLEKKLEEEELKEEIRSPRIHHGDLSDVIPEVTEDLGSEAMIRFLKAKLRVSKEEIEYFSQENNEKEKALSIAESKVKELTEKNTRLERNQQSIQSQIVKYQQLSQQTQHKCEGLQAQLVSLRRELDSQKATQHKAVTNHSAVEVRLNRALEEVERYKVLYNRLKSDSKDLTKQEKHRIEELESENKTLERQKNELITAFKKQMKLIDVLKRQKIHLEAARMLAFTEEEFIKTLDWEST